MSKPGTRVRIGRQMPRYSAGASGFMSYMSRWLGPPSSQIRMTDVLRGARAEADRRCAEKLRQAEAGHARNA